VAGVDYLPIRLESGDIIQVGVERKPVASAEGALEGFLGGEAPVAAQAERHFGKAVDVVRTVASHITKGLLSDDGPAHELAEVKMALELGFDVKGGVFIAQGGASASLKIEMIWKSPRAEK
jgi:Trypsin-co-occurring domain 1